MRETISGLLRKRETSSLNPIVVPFRVDSKRRPQLAVEICPIDDSIYLALKEIVMPVRVTMRVTFVIAIFTAEEILRAAIERGSETRLVRVIYAANELRRY